MSLQENLPATEQDFQDWTSLKITDSCVCLSVEGNNIPHGAFFSTQKIYSWEKWKIDIQRYH